MLDSEPPDMEELSAALSGGVSAPELAYVFNHARLAHLGRTKALGASETVIIGKHEPHAKRRVAH
jgi:hypothetical protein